MEHLLLGEILLSLDLITKRDLRRCIQIQRRADTPRPLGEVIVAEGLIEPAVLASVLAAQNKQAVAPETLGFSQQQLASYLEHAGGMQFLEFVRGLGCSDLHISTGRAPAIRLHGNLVDLPTAPMAFERARDLILSMLTREQVNTYYTAKAVDTLISAPGVGRFRASVFRVYGGIGAVFHILNDEIVPLEQLGLAPIAREFSNYRTGLVLITGKTGSGKSTTLTSLIDLINKSHAVHIISLESPIKTVFESGKALITQREVNPRVSSYAGALQEALREDPDVIALDELNDPETVAAALTAAEAGHLVIGTLYTDNAPNTVARLIEQFPEQERGRARARIAETLRAIVCQQLVPNADRKGRSLAHEVMINDSAISNLIREGREWQIPNIMQVSRGEGMLLMDDSLKKLVLDNRVTRAEAVKRVADPESFMVPA